MSQEARSPETAQEEHKKRFLEKIEAFKLIALQTIRACELMEKEVRGENNS